jgi:hypothetical protein
MDCLLDPSGGCFAAAELGWNDATRTVVVLVCSIGCDRGDPPCMSTVSLGRAVLVACGRPAAIVMMGLATICHDLLKPSARNDLLAMICS